MAITDKSLVRVPKVDNKIAYTNRLRLGADDIIDMYMQVYAVAMERSRCDRHNENMPQHIPTAKGCLDGIADIMGIKKGATTINIEGDSSMPTFNMNY